MQLLKFSLNNRINTGFGTSCDLGYDVTVFFLKTNTFIQAFQRCFLGISVIFRVEGQS